MIRGIHHLGVHTVDLDRLRTFYGRAFGFQAVGEEFDLEMFPESERITGVPGAAARVVMLRAGDLFLEVFQWSTPGGEPIRPRRANSFGYTHFAIDVADIGAEYRRLSAIGMTFVHPSPVWSGDVASVYGHDPDGNLIEILEIPPTNGLHLP